MNTPFDLESSLAAWRVQFCSHEAISHAQVDELESHLRDSIADLNQNGLSLEESFLVARHRLGGEYVAEEMQQAAPVRLWATRAKWMFVGVLSYYAISSILLMLGGTIQIATALIFPSANATRIAAFLASCLSLGILVWTMWQVAQGRWQFTKIENFALLRRPWLLAFCIAGVVALGKFMGLLQTIAIVHSLSVQSYAQIVVMTRWLGLGEALLVLVALAFAIDRAKQAAKG